METRNAYGNLNTCLDATWDVWGNQLHIGGDLFCADVSVRRTEVGYVVELTHSEWTREEQKAYQDPGVEKEYKVSIIGHDAAAMRAVIAGMVYEHGYTVLPSHVALCQVQRNM